MSATTSSRKPKSLSGNGSDPPHMQSSLSPQGFGLYNYGVGGGGGGDAPFAIQNSSLNTRNKQTFQYNDYLSPPQKQQECNTASGGDGGGWRSQTGNENSATHNNFGGGGGGSYLNATSAPSFDSSKIIRPPPLSSPKVSEMGPQQSLYRKIGERLAGTGNGSALMGAGTPTMIRSGRIIPGSVELDRDRKKDRLIDSLSQSDMITCLPGFKKRPAQLASPRKSWPPNDKVVHRIAQQGMSSSMMDYPSAPTPTVERSPVVPSSSYARQAPASLSPALNYNHDRFTSNVGGGEARNIGDEIGRYINTSRDSDSFSGGNPMRDFPGGNARPIPPCSPITRAKAAIGQAQDEILKINNVMEEEGDRRKPPGAWKNMGTPFFSEPIARSAQKQQKVQYRMELERQILASKMRKAEQQRKEKDGNDHPLGPEYAHPALTYYNPPQKIFNPQSSTATTANAALTQYMKEKYALGTPSPSPRSTLVSSQGYPQEIGASSGTVAGRLGPLQQAKMEKVLGNSNLMKSRVQAGDQNQVAAPRFPLHQNQPQQQVLGQESPPPPFNQQRSSAPGPAPQTFPPHYGYPPGMQQRQFQYAMNGWPMYQQHPAYAQYYGQLGTNTSGAVNPQQAYAASQYYQQQQQQQQHSPPSHSPRLPPRPSSSSHLPHLLEDPRFDRSYERGGCDDGAEDEDDYDIDFEALKEKAYKSQKIWQTSDELPDPGIKTAVYKVELRKQIDEDRKRKAERLAREKMEDERIERKIKEFQDEERRRMAIEERARAELEEYTQSRNKKQRRKNEAFTVSQSQNSGRQQRQPNPRRRRQRSRSLSPDFQEERGRMGEGDFEDLLSDLEPHNNNYMNMMMMTDQEDRCGSSYNEGHDHEGFLLPASAAENVAQPVRKSSPPVPVVQRKLLLLDKTEKLENKNIESPATQISPRGQDFLYQLKERLKSEKDLVDRRLREKVESTHKNINLLKYTLSNT